LIINNTIESDMIKYLSGINEGISLKKIRKERFEKEKN